MLDFSVLKIINRVAKMGKDMKEIFHIWDVDKNGFCKLLVLLFNFSYSGHRRNHKRHH
jgi:hypothetical protein